MSGSARSMAASQPCRRTMDEITAKMQAVNWMYADKDANALLVLEERIADTGRKLALITYSDLVRGVDFHLPNVKNGQPYRIQTYDWSGFDRAIIGEFLGFISTRSYLNANFMASALVVSGKSAEEAYQPSEHFFEWMEILGVLPDLKRDTVLAFWADQVNKAHIWYKSH
jgi:hypothetical protein